MFALLLAAERRRVRGLVVAATLAACGLGAASVLLPALSGWFISHAALAGAGGVAAAMAFNTVLPSAGIRLLAILRTVSRYGERLAGHDAALRMMARVRPAVFAALAAAPPACALAMSSGEMTARVTNDASEVEAGLVRQPAAWSAVAAVLAGIALLLASGPAALAVLALLIAALAIGASMLARAGAARGAEVARQTGALKDAAMQLLSAREELRAYGLEEWASARLAEHATALAAAQRRASKTPALFELAAASAAGAATMATLALCAAQTLPVAALSALGALALVEAVAGWGRGLQRRGQLAAATRRLDALLAVPKRVVTPAARPRHAVIEAPRLGIRLMPGTVQGIVGPSGCGKTTFLETLAGLREAAPGLVRIDGEDLACLPAGAARPLVSLLAQDAPILTGTIRENLLLACPDALDPDLWAALRCAVLDARVAALPGGLDAWVGEGGARLSGGERRRLCLARALLRDAPYLLLDEPTEGLEAATEARVVARLRLWLRLRGRGAIIVTHRPAPLALCARIVRLDALDCPVEDPDRRPRHTSSTGRRA